MLGLPALRHIVCTVKETARQQSFPEVYCRQLRAIPYRQFTGHSQVVHRSFTGYSRLIHASKNTADCPPCRLPPLHQHAFYWLDPEA